jgi:hypothetical protein
MRMPRKRHNHRVHPGTGAVQTRCRLATHREAHFPARHYATCRFNSSLDRSSAAIGQAKLIVERGLTSFALGSPKALELFAVRDQAREHTRRLGDSLDDQVEAGEQALTLCVAHEIGAMQSAGREEIAPADTWPSWTDAVLWSPTDPNLELPPADAATADFDLDPDRRAAEALTEAWLADSRDNDALAVAEAMAELQPIPPLSGGAPTEPTEDDWRDYGEFCAEYEVRRRDRAGQWAAARGAWPV